MWSPMFEYTHDLVDGHLCSLKENIDWRAIRRTRFPQHPGQSESTVRRHVSPLPCAGST